MLRRKSGLNNSIDPREIEAAIWKLQTSTKEERMVMIDGMDRRVVVGLIKTTEFGPLIDSTTPVEGKRPVFYPSLSSYLPLFYWYYQKGGPELLIPFVRSDFITLSEPLQRFIIEFLYSLDREKVKNQDLLDLACKTFKHEYKKKQTPARQARSPAPKAKENLWLLLAIQCFKTSLLSKFQALPQSARLKYYIEPDDLREFDFVGYCSKLHKAAETMDGLSDHIFSIELASFGQFGDMFTPERGVLKRTNSTALATILRDIFFLIGKLGKIPELVTVGIPLKVDCLLRLSKFQKNVQDINFAPIQPSEFARLQDISFPRLTKITFPSFNFMNLNSSSTSLENSLTSLSPTEESCKTFLCKYIERYAESLEELNFSQAQNPVFTSAVIGTLDTSRGSVGPSQIKKPVSLFPKLTTLILPQVKVTSELCERINTFPLTTLQIEIEDSVDTEKLLSNLALPTLRSFSLTGKINHPHLLAELLSSSVVLVKLDLSTSALKLQRLEELIQSASPRGHEKLEIFVSLRESRNVENDRAEILRINGLLQQKRKNIDIVIAP